MDKINTNALFIRTSKSGSNKTGGWAKNVFIESFTPDRSVGDFAIKIRFDVDTGHSCTLCLYNEYARLFLKEANQINSNS